MRHCSRVPEMRNAEFAINSLDASSIEAFLRSVDSDFPIALSKKANLSELSEKLASKADVLAYCRCGRILSLVAGYATNSIDGRAYVSVVSTAPASRGEGLAAELLAEFCDLAQSMGIEEVHLYCDASNGAAISMYRSAGFIAYSDPSEVRTEDIHFHKSLNFSFPRAWLTSDRPNILLSSVGRRSYLVDWFRDALDGEGKVCVTNSDPATPAFAVADVAEVSPIIYSDEYIPYMIDFCERHRVGAIVPLFDVDVPMLAAHRHEFEASGVFPVVAPEAFALTCSDKLDTARLLDEAGISHPATYVGAEDFIDAVLHGETSYPAFVKPRWGMGSIGLAVAEDETELRVLCGIAERKVAGSYLKYESAADASRSVIVQPVLRGQEYGLDVINDLAGAYQACVVRKKVAMRAGETDVAEVLVGDPRFEELARKLSALSRHPGNMDVDVFDVDGKLMVLEMNARFGGGYPFSHAAGVDLPSALVMWLRGERCSQGLFEVTRPGSYMKDISVIRLEEDF